MDGAGDRNGCGHDGRRDRVATDTRGITRKIFARSRWAATGSRSARFAGKQDIEIFGNGCFDNGPAGPGRDHFGFGVNVLDLEMFLG